VARNERRLESEMAQAARERFAKKNEAEDLRRAFEKLDTKSDGKIDCEELNTVFQMLNHKTKKSEIEDMIWEVDDDCDKCVNWPEFQAMYHRCRNDKTGASLLARYFFSVGLIFKSIEHLNHARL